jgi:CBS domain containing-hemolysin-like protein
MALKPFVWLSKTITSRLGSSGHSHTFSREEFRAMAEIASAEGHMDEQETAIVRNLLRFRATTVSAIMTPRPVVFMLPADLTVREFVELHGEQPFSRIPLYGENRDDVKGFVLRVQVLQAHALGDSERKLEALMQPLYSVTVESTLMALFARMTGKRAHLSLVVDEFGAMQGIVTLEDLIETLVGFEIVDETDEAVDMQVVARQLWESRAKKIGLKPEALVGEEAKED